MANALERNVHCILGLPFDALDMADVASRVRDAATRRQPFFFSTPNVNFLVACLTDEAFRNSVIESDLSIADGMPLVWTAKLLRIPIQRRVTGSGVFEGLRNERGKKRISVYFFGGMEGVAEAACMRLNENPSGFVCVGFESPGFGTIEEMSSDATITRINASHADFLVVSLGARKGQAWITRNRTRLSTPVISHLGAVVNFVAGTVVRAPRWMRQCGLEWLWRISQEPALWRRYCSDGLVFLRLLITRVLPYSWLILIHNPGSRELGAATLESLSRGTEIAIKLGGPWTQGNVDRLRKCFSEPALAGKDVCLDMGHVTYVDSAFMGLLMLLYGSQKRQGRQLLVVKLTKRVKRIFKYACADFLLEVR